MARPQWQSNIVEAYQRLDESNQAAGERFIQTIQKVGDTFSKIGKETYEVLKDYNKTVLERKQKEATAEFTRGMLTATSQAERAKFVAGFDMSMVDPAIASQTFVQLKNVDQIDKSYLLELERHKETVKNNMQNENLQRLQLVSNYNIQAASDELRLAGQVAEALTKQGKSQEAINFLKTQSEKVSKLRSQGMDVVLKNTYISPTGSRDESFNTLTFGDYTRQELSDTETPIDLYQDIGYYFEQGKIVHKEISKDGNVITTEVQNPTQSQIKQANSNLSKSPQTTIQSKSSPTNIQSAKKAVAAKVANAVGNNPPPVNAPPAVKTESPQSNSPAKENAAVVSSQKEQKPIVSNDVVSDSVNQINETLALAKTPGVQLDTHLTIGGAKVNPVSSPNTSSPVKAENPKPTEKAKSELDTIYQNLQDKTYISNFLASFQSNHNQKITNKNHYDYRAYTITKDNANKLINPNPNVTSFTVKSIIGQRSFNSTVHTGALEAFLNHVFQNKATFECVPQLNTNRYVDSTKLHLSLTTGSKIPPHYIIFYK